MHGWGGQKYLVLIPYGTTTTRFLFYMMFLKNLPPGFFISFLSMTRHHGPSLQAQAASFIDKAPWPLTPPSAGSSMTPPSAGVTEPPQK
jgi:hypothetical protein